MTVAPCARALPLPSTPAHQHPLHTTTTSTSTPPRLHQQPMSHASLRPPTTPAAVSLRSTRVCAPRSTRCRHSKMHVPSDSFGGLSPERKAAQALEALLTFTAAKIVLAQLEGSGRGALGAYDSQAYGALSSHLQEVPLRDAEAWLAALMAKDKGTALRLMEVRASYARLDFEWDQLQRLSIKAVQDSNLKLMRAAAEAGLSAGPQTHPIDMPQPQEPQGEGQPAAAAAVAGQQQQQQAAESSSSSSVATAGATGGAQQQEPPLSQQEPQTGDGSSSSSNSTTV